jgi:hypothetical protein
MLNGFQMNHIFYVHILVCIYIYISDVIRESLRTYFLQMNTLLSLLPEATVRGLYEYILVCHMRTTLDNNMLRN